MRDLCPSNCDKCEKHKVSQKADPNPQIFYTQSRFNNFSFIQLQQILVGRDYCGQKEHKNMNQYLSAYTIPHSNEKL